MFVTMKIFSKFVVDITTLFMGTTTPTIILSNKELCDIFDLTKECFGIDEYVLSTLHDSWLPLMSLRSDPLNAFALPLNTTDYTNYSNAVFDNKYTTHYLEDYDSEELKLVRYAMYIIAYYVKYINTQPFEEGVHALEYAKSMVQDDMLKLYRLCKQIESGKFSASQVEISVSNPINKTTDKGVGRECIVIDNWNDWLFSKALIPFLEKYLTDIDTIDKANKRWLELHPRGRKCDKQQEALIYGCYLLLRKFCKTDAKIPSSVCAIISNYVQYVLPYSGESSDTRTAENISSRLKHIMRQGKQSMLYTPPDLNNLQYIGESKFGDL